MKKIILFLLAILYVGICKAQLSVADCKYSGNTIPVIRIIK